MQGRAVSESAPAPEVFEAKLMIAAAGQASAPDHAMSAGFKEEIAK